AYFAVRHNDATPTDGSAATDTPTASTASTGPSIVGPLSLAVAPSGALVRATRGSCDSRDPVTARLWVANAFKAPLDRVRVPGLVEVLGLTMSDGRLAVVGADQSCKTHGYVSTDKGKTWSRTGIPRAIWWLDVDTTATRLHGPVSGRVLNIDCRPVGISTIDRGKRALVSCADFNVVDQPTAADVPPITYGVDGPVAATLAKGKPLVLATSDRCLASLRRVTSQTGTKQIACLGNEGAPLGLAVTGTRVFAQVGQRLAVSTDGGRSFDDYPGTGA
ncbi:MAG: hypothetical protein ABJA93_14595, partial [Sporichthyaceae bacterium]